MISMATYFREHFRARIYLTFSALIVMISIAFTFFFFRYQSSCVVKEMVGKGELITGLFANTARLGTFSENPEQLRGPLDDIMKNGEVVSVAVFTADGRLLAFRNRSGGGNGPDPAVSAPIFQELSAQAPPSLHFREAGDFTFFYRMSLRPAAIPGEGRPSGVGQRQEQPLGFVRLVLDDRLLQESLHALLQNSIVIGFSFLLLGLAVAYPVVSKITRPLDSLTRGVMALEMGQDPGEMPVETEDEIGRLATAFNTMVGSLKKREAEKQELAEKLRHSQKMEAMGTLAGGIAHDFNNILNIIRPCCEALRTELTSQERALSYATRIEGTVDKAASLTQRLLAFSRNQVLKPKPEKLNGIVSGCADIIALMLPKNVRLLVELDPADPTVLVDQGQLDHVLLNLATNARDAMPDGGTLTLRTGLAMHDEARCAVVTVADTGIGMTDEVRQRVFDPFFTTKEVGKGTGLGLSMAYGIVQQHEGTIEVATAPGRGAAFSIYFPTVEQNPRPAPEPAWEIARGNGETILFAEDNEEAMSLLKEVLESNGYKVIAAIDGGDAISKFIENQGSIRLAILDIMMPKKNGRQVHQEITRLKPQLRTLFMSGYTSGLLDEGPDLEGVDLIPKPVRLEELFGKIKALLEADGSLGAVH